VSSILQKKFKKSFWWISYEEKGIPGIRERTWDPNCTQRLALPYLTNRSAGSDFRAPGSRTPWAFERYVCEPRTHSGAFKTSTCYCL